MREAVLAALKDIRPLLGGTDVALGEVKDGVVTLAIVVPRCGSSTPRELALEIIEEELRDAVPDVKEVIAV